MLPLCVVRCHRVTLCRHRTCFRCSLAVDQVRGHLRAKFKIPYSYGHLVSMSEQCDASIKILIWDGYIKTTKTPDKKFNRIAFWPSISKRAFLQLCKTNQLHIPPLGQDVFWVPSIWIMSPCLYWRTLELLPINNMFELIQNHITFPFW